MQMQRSMSFINAFPRIDQSLTPRNDCMSAESQMLLTLSYYSDGSFLRVSGDFCGVSKSTASKTMIRVSHAIALQSPQFIKILNDYAQEARGKFYQIARLLARKCNTRKRQTVQRNANIFDGALPAIGATSELNSLTRLNLMNNFTPDYELLIIIYVYTSIVARITHDAHIFRNSTLYHRFESGHFGNDLLVVASAILHNIACDERDSVPLLNDRMEEAIVQCNNMFDGALPAIAAKNELNSLTRLNITNNFYSRL
nr:unnamed protein product [Callosobruchus analis]